MNTIRARECTTDAGGGYLYVRSHRINLDQLHAILKENDVEFVNTKNPAHYLLSALKQQEPTQGDTEFLKRIIREGGLSRYALKLEGLAHGK